jgi:hypothetical protein
MQLSSVISLHPIMDTHSDGDLSSKNHFSLVFKA